jgi:hypothetical protein
VTFSSVFISLRMNHMARYVRGKHVDKTARAENVRGCGHHESRCAERAHAQRWDRAGVPEAGKNKNGSK